MTMIPLLPLGQAEQGKITQLYRYLELFSEGTPPRHSLFVYAPASGPLNLGSGSHDEQLLIIDPPANFEQRFRLGNQVAVLFTAAPAATSLALLQTVPGGVAHIRIGDHFLDIYTQRHGAVVHLPALGIICGGEYGSDATIPRLAAGSDGSDELDTLRLLARLIKQQRLSLYIPRTGAQIADKVVVMEKLAADVGYINALRRVVTPLALRGESVEAISDLAENVLPRDRRMPLAVETHNKNITSLLQSAAH
jgi:hypothetical protein